jgi:hypothetical protein
MVFDATMLGPGLQRNIFTAQHLCSTCPLPSDW